MCTDPPLPQFLRVPVKLLQPHWPYPHRHIQRHLQPMLFHFQVQQMHMDYQC